MGRVERVRNAVEELWWDFLFYLRFWESHKDRNDLRA